MQLLYRAILYIIVVTLILPAESGFPAAHTRAKRVVAFRKGSAFFYRLNYKISSIPSSTIFAQATGFKVTWKLPSGSMEKRKRRNVDEIHDSAELVFTSHGFDGRACVAKNICQALEYVQGNEGVMAKILKLLTEKTSDNGTISTFDKIACQRHSSRCPLELVGINGLVDTFN